MENENRMPGGTADLLRPTDDATPAAADGARGDMPATAMTDRNEPNVELLPGEAGEEFSRRWEQCQSHFVDEPRESVEQADQLVADVIRELASHFASARQGLETQWSRGEEVTTEDLRVVFQRYRSFFNRLIAV